MLKTFKLVLFGIASLLILGIISTKIILAERAMLWGNVCRFAVEGYDPHDVFRGRYLQIRLNATAKRTNLVQPYGRSAYVTIGTDKEGTSFFDELRSTPPESGDYLAVTLPYWRFRVNANREFESPFTRFYLNEKLAPKAEKVLNQALAGNGKARLVLRVYNGFACIEDLEIDGKSIRELAAAE